MMGAVRPRRKERPQTMMDAMEKGLAKETTYTMMGQFDLEEKKDHKRWWMQWKEGKRRRQHTQ